MVFHRHPVEHWVDDTQPHAVVLHLDEDDGSAIGEMLGRKNPCSSNCYNWILSSQSSSDDIRYGPWEICVVLGNISSPYSTSLTGGKLLGH